MTNFPTRPAELKSNVPETPSIESEIRDAFSHVAHGYTTTLFHLLDETRRRGLSDDDVRAFLVKDELDAAYEGMNTRHLHCLRAGDGAIFIESCLGNDAGPASFHEAFADMSGNDSGSHRSDPCRSGFNGLISLQMDAHNLACCARLLSTCPEPEMAAMITTTDRDQLRGFVIEQFEGGGDYVESDLTEAVIALLAEAKPAVNAIRSALLA